jgi:hypothetical protein
VGVGVEQGIVGVAVGVVDVVEVLILEKSVVLREIL